MTIHLNISPMLATPYKGWFGPCYSQPKLDGVRCIATATAIYTPGRRGQLQKRKPFDDAEFVCTDFERGANGEALHALCIAANGEPFKAKLRANSATRRGVRPASHMVLTVRHMGFTANGLPRHPVAVGFHGPARTL